VPMTLPTGPGPDRGRGRQANAPYNKMYNIIHNIKGFKGIVKGDLTTLQVLCYLKWRFRNSG
jgi:hypothetical protein